MNQCLKHWCWQFRAINCLVWGLVTFSESNAWAQSQITPDNTLGAESSIVLPHPDGLPSEVISGGAERDENLFHSFDTFNIAEGWEAYFVPSDGIETILSRVTGESHSDLLGTLGVLGDADLFFINPNGIIFGENARLNIAGSFLASTASSILFDNSFEFSAAVPQSPPLLTISAPIGLQTGENLGRIINRSVADGIGLAVRSGQTLSLIGGEIDIQNGLISSLDGPIVLGSVGADSRITLNSAGVGYEEVEAFQNISFTQAAEVSTFNRGSVQLQGEEVTFSDEAQISAANFEGEEGGSLSLQAAKLILEGNSSIETSVLGLDEGGDVTIEVGQLHLRDGARLEARTSGVGNAGALNITADRVELAGGSSGLFAEAGITATGDTAGITINTEQLVVRDGARVESITNREGNAGAIEVIANEVELVGASSGLFSEVGLLATKGSDGLTLNTDRLIVRDGARVESSTAGDGTAGAVEVTASKVELDGSGSGLFSEVGIIATRNSDGLIINTDRLAVRDGAQIESTTFGEGNAGEIIVTAGEVELTGVSSGIFSSADSGDSEGLTINAERLSIQNEARVETLTFGEGSPGDLTIDAGQAILQNQGLLAVSGEENVLTGDLIITADNVLLEDQSSIEADIEFGSSGNVTLDVQDSLRLSRNSQIRTETTGTAIGGNITISIPEGEVVLEDSDITATFTGGEDMTEADPMGRGGQITIQTGTLSLREGSQLTTRTTGRGDVGNIEIQAEGAVLATRFSSGISSLVERGAIGQGGDISLQADTLALNDGALLTYTRGTGDSGNITARLNGNITMNNGDIVTNVLTEGIGRGGNITLETETGAITLASGSEISSSTFGQGDAGDVLLQAPVGAVSLLGSFIQTRTESMSAAVGLPGFRAAGDGGDIVIQAASLSLLPDSYPTYSALATDTNAEGNAGNILLQIDGPVSINNSRISAAVDPNGTGQGGDIDITAETLSIEEGAFVNASTRGQGPGGNLRVNVGDFVKLSGANAQGYTSELATSTRREATGRAGSILIEGPVLQILDGATINARTLSSERGGDVNISVDRLGATDGGQILTSSLGSGRAGSIRLSAAETIFLSGEDLTYFERLARLGLEEVAGVDSTSGVFANAETTSTGAGGDLHIATDRLVIQDGAGVNVSNEGTGNAGNLGIAARTIFLDNRGSITAETRSGNGGSIALQDLDMLLLRNNSRISTTAGTAQVGGDGGNLSINARDGFVVSVPNENSDITANAFEGQGGRVEITAQGILGFVPRTAADLRQLGVNSPGLVDPATLPTNDITAISQAAPELSGLVILNTLAPELNTEQIELPTTVVETEVAQSCQTGSDQPQSTFVVTGRGGVPPLPSEALDSRDIDVSLVTLSERDDGVAGLSQDALSPGAIAPAGSNSVANELVIVEAQEWAKDEAGTVHLLARVSEETSATLPSADCQTARPSS